MHFPYMSTPKDNIKNYDTYERLKNTVQIRSGHDCTSPMLRDKLCPQISWNVLTIISNKYDFPNPEWVSSKVPTKFQCLTMPSVEKNVKPNIFKVKKSSVWFNAELSLLIMHSKK